MRKRKTSQFIYITGCDGTGKSTYTMKLLEDLERSGYEPARLWLRFPFFISLPFLLYARWRRLSWYEKTGNIRHGYWDFQKSWIMRNIFPWAMFIDAVGVTFIKIYVPLNLGKTILCERFVVDMMVDLEVGLGDFAFHKKAPGKWFHLLLPENSLVIMLDLDEHLIRMRRDDLESDRMLLTRLNVFKIISKDLAMPIVNTNASVEEVYQSIIMTLGINGMIDGKLRQS